MAVYTYKGAALTGDTLRLTEHHLYGSSRLGIWARKINMDLPPQNGITVNLLGKADTLGQQRGNKLFELTNHLGNVLATVSDRRGQVNANADTLVDYFIPDVVTANDYYPFGMLMQQTAGDGSGVGAGGTDSAMEVVTVSNRIGNNPAQYTATNSVEFMPGFESGTGDSFTAFITGSVEGGSNGGSSTEGGSSMYRYGFNGKELDSEASSTTTYDYGFRIYSPALGRFLSVDPLFKSYPWYTPYQFGGNNPIANIDLDGLEGVKATTSGGKKVAELVKTQSAYIYAAIQASNNTSFDQVYAYTQVDPKVLENEDAFNSLKSLKSKVRGVYGEGVATYLTVEAIKSQFDIKFDPLTGFRSGTKNTPLENGEDGLKAGEASYSLQNGGFDFTLSFRTGQDGSASLFKKVNTLFTNFSNADGSADAEFYAANNTKTFGFEVKTYNPDNTSINMVGYDQAVQKMVGDYYLHGGQLNSGTLIPVLQTDEAAWNNAYQKDPDRMQNIYDKLNKVGGKLQLITNLYSGSNDQMQQTRRETNATP